jgi:hypothetical protein
MKIKQERERKKRERRNRERKIRILNMLHYQIRASARKNRKKKSNKQKKTFRKLNRLCCRKTFLLSEDGTPRQRTLSRVTRLCNFSSIG